MRRIPQRLGLGALVVGLAVVLVALAGALAPAPGGPGARAGAAGTGPAGEAAGARGGARPASAGGTAARAAGDLSAQAEALQARLRRLPGDWDAWAALGVTYVEQARATADPTFYRRAEGALQESLRVRPDGNATALAGSAALAAARHDFAGALEQADAALAVNAYDTAALGVRTDALVELGRYDEAFATLQRMLDLRPGVPALARASYAFELRGDLDGARAALEQALAVASRPADAAFAHQYLAELAFNAGDLAAAATHAEDGLTVDPSAVALRAVRARVLAARGETAAALREWADVVRRLPQPSYLVEYGDLLASLGRTAEAERQYALVAATQRLFQAQGANVDLELALFDADRGRVDAALAAARAEWERRRSVHVADAYAWALHAAGRHSEALEHAVAAERLGTQSALFAYHRGRIEHALGLEGAARASLSRALRLNPHFSPVHAPVAEQLLAELGGAR